MRGASVASAPTASGAARAVERPVWPRRAWSAAAIGLAAFAPLAFSAGGGVLNNMVLAAAYVVMALGLNIIVGFAGLLDLGYVAFFAIGAYTAAYFASGYWSNAGHGRGVAILAGGAASQLPGIHLNVVFVLLVAAGAAMATGA